MLVLSIHFCELLSLQPSLWFISTFSTIPVWLSLLYVYTYAVWKGGGDGFWASQSLFYRSIFLDDIMHCLEIFLRPNVSIRHSPDNLPGTGKYLNDGQSHIVPGSHHKIINFPNTYNYLKKRIGPPTVTTQELWITFFIDVVTLQKNNRNNRRPSLCVL